MCDDILHKVRMLFNNPDCEIPENGLYNFVLYELEKLLNLNSSSLSHYNLPLPTGSLIEDSNNILLRKELNYDRYQLKGLPETGGLFFYLNDSSRAICSELFLIVSSNSAFLLFSFSIASGLAWEMKLSLLSFLLLPSRLAEAFLSSF